MVIVEFPRLFEILTDHPKRDDESWDQLSHTGDLELMWPLTSDKALLHSWSPLRCQYWKGSPRRRCADILYFDCHFAVCGRRVEEFRRIMPDSVEFLKICDNNEAEYFIVRPLTIVLLGKNADGSINRVSGNMTFINKFSFDDDALKFLSRDDKLCFRVAHSTKPNKSKTGVFVNGRLKNDIEAAGFSGIRMAEVFPEDLRYT